MPIVNGEMYAEGRPIIHNFDELSVLILGNIDSDLRTFAIQIDTLHQYLRKTVASSILIKLCFTDVVSDDDVRSINAIKYKINPGTNSELLSAINDFDIDIVLDQNNQFNQKFLWSKFYEFEGVKDLDSLKRSIENYLAGNGIAWSFTDTFWNMPLFMKYMVMPGICMSYYSFMCECVLKKGYSEDQKDKVRYITNKIRQVEYGRDILQYYIKRMRKARRNEMPDDDYNLELNYHLSNYYFLMAGTLDSLARLINNVYKLGLTRFGDLAVEKDAFIARNRKRQTGFVRLFKNKEFSRWTSLLKERRNFIAHDGDMRQTPLVKEKKVLLTDAEINAVVDKQLDWALLASYLPADLLLAQREQSSQIVRIQNNYEIIAEKMMMIPILSGGHKIYSPLIDIDHDYDQFSRIMSQSLERLRK